MAKIHICDCCRYEIGGALSYQIRLSKIFPNDDRILYDLEICGRCFTIFEQDIHRIQKIHEPDVVLVRNHEN